MRDWLVDFTAEGLNAERLIRQAGEAGVTLRDVRRMSGRKLTGRVRADQLDMLAALTEKGGWRFTQGRCYGGGILVNWLKRRWTLVLCLGLALASAVMASQCMWRVELVDAGVYEGDIRTYLDEAGVIPIRWKSTVDPANLRDALEWRYPKAAWIECGWRGVTLRIKVIEGVSAGETQSHLGAGDVVAMRDALVESVVTLAGTALVEAGDVVRKGQVLIRGEERTGALDGEAQTRPVSARGTIMGRVWDGASVRVPILRTETVYTGRKVADQLAACPWFDLWRGLDSGFAAEDVSVRSLPLGGLFFPLTYRVETHMEAKHTLSAAPMAELKAEAGVAALRALRGKVGTADDFVDKWVEYCMIEDEELEATAIGERLLDIGIRVREDAP